jgi:penicillin-binding protein 1A
MEAGSGDVLALVGGRDFGHSRFNRAIDGRRPVGSAFKPIVVLAALREGFVASQPILDRPFTLVQAGSPAWTPQNYDGEHRGPVSLREALVRSLNIPTARLALAVGVEPIVRAARDLGIQDSLPATPALALGTASLSPLELTTAFTTLANGGRPRSPRFVLRVEDAEGRVLFDALESADASGSGEAEGSEDGAVGQGAEAGVEPVPGTSEATEETPGVEPRLAYLVTDLLRDAVDRGTGSGVRRAGFRGPAAGKTGTTQDGADAWFVGYTPRHVATVWIGHDRPSPIVAGASGGTLAAPVWGAVMASVEEASASEWPSAAGIVERRVDVGTGLVLEADCRARNVVTASELFLADRVPVADCPRPESFFRRLTGAFERLFRRRRPEVERAPRDDRADPETVQTFDGTEDAGEILGVDVVRLEGA